MTTYSISFRDNRSNDLTILNSGQHFRFGIDRFQQFFQRPIPDRLVDLLRIAAAVYVVDRLVSRRTVEQRNWSRTLRIQIGVVDPDFWSCDSVKNSLIETLQFLSDDTWELSFYLDDRRTCKEQQSSLFPIPNHACLCLYSGGLDSAAGLANRLHQELPSHVLPVTIWHQPIQRLLIQRQYRFFRARYDSEITPLIAKTAIIWTPELRERFRGETSQRARAFLFTSAGAVAAAAIGASQVELFESGVGAINLPLMTGMVGSRTTRGTHPAFLRRMSELTSLILDRPMAFVLPFFQQTKGQVVGNAKSAGLLDVARLTVSCVHFPLRELSHKQCGVCPACIFRQQSLAVAGIDEPSGTYKYDLFQNSEAANTIPAEQLLYLKAFIDQIVQLDDLTAAEVLPSRIRRHLLGTGVLAHGESVEPIQRLLRIYRDEWNEVFAQARRRGIAWANLVGFRTSKREGVPHVVA